MPQGSDRVDLAQRSGGQLLDVQAIPGGGRGISLTDPAAADPDEVAALQARANELAATMAKPLLLQAAFGALRERLHLPPALPGEEASFNEQP